MGVKIPYWNLQGDKNQYFLMEYGIIPKRVIENPHFKDISPYSKRAFVSRLQVPQRLRNEVSGPLLARQEGGRTMTFAEEDSIVRINESEFSINVKGSGMLATAMQIYDPIYYYDYKNLIDGSSHWHTLLDRTLPEYLGFKTDFNPRTTPLFSIITKEDIDSDAAGPHRPLGGQNLDLAFTALRNSDSLYSNTLDMLICPTISVSELDEDVILDPICPKTGEEPCRKNVKNIKYAQEIRLLPSNIRPTPGEYDLGIYPLTNDFIDGKLSKSLKDNGIDKGEFCDNFIRTSSDIHFLTHRAAKPAENGLYKTYIYSDANPERDSPIDMTGRMHFADLESIAPVEMSPLLLQMKETQWSAGAFLREVSRVVGLEHGGKVVFNDPLNIIAKNYKKRIEDVLPEGISIRFLPAEDKAVIHSELGGEQVNFEINYKTGITRVVLR